MHAATNRHCGPWFASASCWNSWTRAKGEPRQQNMPKRTPRNQTEQGATEMINPAEKHDPPDETRAVPVSDQLYATIATKAMTKYHRAADGRMFDSRLVQGWVDNTVSSLANRVRLILPRRPSIYVPRLSHARTNQNHLTKIQPAVVVEWWWRPRMFISEFRLAWRNCSAAPASTQANFPTLVVPVVWLRRSAAAGRSMSYRLDWIEPFVLNLRARRLESDRIFRVERSTTARSLVRRWGSRDRPTPNRRHVQVQYSYERPYLRE